MYARSGADAAVAMRRSSSFELEFLAPEDAGPVDPADVLGDAVAAAVVAHRFPAGDDGAVVVHDAEAAGRELRIERGQGLPGGGIEVAVQPEHGQAVDRRLGKRVPEPAGQKANLPVEQSVTP